MGYLAGDYLGTNRRYGANTMVANVYNNNYFISAKECFLREHQVMNRKFTDTEKACFVENMAVRAAERDQSMKRKYIYNPALHGPSKEAFDQMVATYLQDNVDPTLRPGVAEDISLQNTAKSALGEKVVVRPVQVDELIDPSGLKYGLKFNTWTQGWNMI